MVVRWDIRMWEIWNWFEVDWNIESVFGWDFVFSGRDIWFVIYIIIVMLIFKVIFWRVKFNIGIYFLLILLKKKEYYKDFKYNYGNVCFLVYSLLLYLFIGVGCW